MAAFLQHVDGSAARCITSDPFSAINPETRLWLLDGPLIGGYKYRPYCGLMDRRYYERCQPQYLPRDTSFDKFYEFVEDFNWPLMLVDIENKSDWDTISALIT